MPPRLFFLRLAALSLIITLPLYGCLLLKWPISSDYLFYASLLHLFSAQFWSGEWWYPRWLIDANDGLGSPAFLFFGPLPYHVASLFEWLAPYDPYGFWRLPLHMTLALFVAGIAMRRWLHRLQGRFGPLSAESGALLYLYFPYMAYILYGVYGMPQLWALALFPFLLEAAEDMTRTGWRAIPKFSLSLALLLLTHLPSVLTFLAIPCAYAVFFAPRAKRMTHAALTGCAVLLGGALAACYLLPVIANKPFISSELFISKPYYFADNFNHPVAWIGFLAVLAPLLGFFTELPPAIKRQAFRMPHLFWVLCLAGTGIMLLPLSLPIWLALPPLHNLQVPFRFYNAMLPVAVVLTLLWMPHVKTRAMWKWMSVAVFSCCVVYAYSIFYYPVNVAQKDLNANRLYIGFGQASQALDTPWLRRDANGNVIGESMRERAQLAQGTGEVAVLAWQERRIRLRADITSGQAEVRLRRFYFPGWQAEGGDLILGQDDGLLSLRLPQGRHDLRLTLPHFAGEKAGNAISLAGLAALAALFLCSRLRKPQTANTTSA